MYESLNTYENAWSANVATYQLIKQRGLGKNMAGLSLIIPNSFSIPILLETGEEQALQGERCVASRTAWFWPRILFNIIHIFTDGYVLCHANAILIYNFYDFELIVSVLHYILGI